MDLPLVIVDSAAVLVTFTLTTAATVAATVGSTGLKSGNLSGKLVLCHLGYCGCEVISHLRICNAVKVSPDFKIFDCVGD